MSRMGMMGLVLALPALLHLGDPPAAQRVTLRFDARVGDRRLACGESYDGIGRSRTRITPTDFRMYVHDVRLVTPDGREVPLALDRDSTWQDGQVALLDFEDGTGPCRNGTKGVRREIRGQAPAGTYTGVRFRVGVPFEQNHGDLTRQRAPLDLTAMFWTWRTGYTFVRMDARVESPVERLFFHLGSTRCVRDDSAADATLPPDRCLDSNRPAVALEDFNPARDTIVTDLAQLLAESRLDSNQVNTAKGCMSGETDLDCDPMFAALGLPFGSRAGGPQRVFRVSGRAATVGAYRVPTGAFRWALPAGFPEPRVPADNPMTVAKVELGRHLFHDRRLSRDSSMSCSSCHQQGYAFSDPRVHPVGITGQAHPRTSMSLANVAYSPSLTWANLRMQHLEQQALVPMFGEDPIEMGMTGAEAELLRRLRDEPRYRALFPAAFPGERDPFVLANVTRAIAAFERTLLSGASAYDRFHGGEAGAMSEAARRGETLFLSERLECFHCHGGFLFTGTVDHLGKANPEVEFHNTGLYNLDGRGAYPAPNVGLMESTGDPADMGSFKAPSLRNVAVTAPYMHDGSIATLAEVVAHYMAGGRTITSGPHAGVGSANPLKSAFVPGFTLTEGERADLLAFLESLTDPAFLADARFADPWPAARAAR